MNNALGILPWSHVAYSTNSDMGFDFTRGPDWQYRYLSVNLRAELLLAAWAWDALEFA